MPIELISLDKQYAIAVGPYSWVVKIIRFYIVVTRRFLLPVPNVYNEYHGKGIRILRDLDYFPLFPLAKSSIS